MRILLIAPHTTLADPTPSAIFPALLKAYKKNGHEAVLATWGPPSLRQGHFDSSIYHLRVGSVYRDISTLARRAHFAHWFLCDYWNPACQSSHAACRNAGIPWGATLLERGYAERLSPNFSIANNAAKKQALAEFLRGCAWVTTPSSALAEGLRADYPCLKKTGVHIVGHGYDPEEVNLAAANRPPGRFILCVGRLTHYKGVDVLLWAFRKAIDRGTDITLVLCGQQSSRHHPLRGFVRKLGMSRRVRFFGRIGRSAAIRLMRRSLFCVLPSRTEAFGISALEAMACGKAVVATKSGGPQDFIEDDVSGLLVPPGDPETMADAIWRLWKDASLRVRIERNAKKAAAPYTWGKIAGRYLPLVESACEIRSPSSRVMAVA